MPKVLENILIFISGIGVFLFGIKTMTESINKLAGSKLTKNLSKFTNNRFKGLFFGTAFTAVMQSSSATVAMLVSFAGAGVLTLFQTIAVVFGANIGTILAEFLVSFGNIGVSVFFAALAGVGAFILLFAKKDGLRNFAKILIGVGLLFVGTKLMKEATNFLGESQAFKDLVLKINNPLLLILIGFAFTVVVQSSLGSIVILMGIAAAPGSTITLYQCAFYLMGTNIGTTLTAFLASLGTQEGKRVAMTHFLFNVFGTIVFLILMLSLRYDKWIIRATDNTNFQIVLLNVIFNVFTALLLLPFVQYIEKFIRLIIRDKKETGQFAEFVLREDTLAIPALAFSKIEELNIVMIKKIEEMLAQAMSELKSGEFKGINKMVAMRDFLLTANMKFSDQVAKLLTRDISGFEHRARDQIKLNGELNSIIKHVYIFYEYAVEYLSNKYDTCIIDESVGRFYEQLCRINNMGKNILTTGSDAGLELQQDISDQIIAIIETEESIAVSKNRFKKEQIERLKKNADFARPYGLCLNMMTELDDIAGKFAGIFVKAK